MHAIDVSVIESGSSYIDKWLVVLCLGSGQTRNMALDRYILLILCKGIWKALLDYECTPYFNLSLLTWLDTRVTYMYSPCTIPIL